MMKLVKTQADVPTFSLDELKGRLHKYPRAFLMLGRYDVIIQQEIPHLTVGGILEERPLTDDYNTYWDLISIFGTPVLNATADFAEKAVGFCFLKSSEGNRIKLRNHILGRVKSQYLQYDVDRCAALYDLCTWQDLLLILGGRAEDILDFVKNRLRLDTENPPREGTHLEYIRESSTMFGIGIPDEKPELHSLDKGVGNIDVIVLVKIVPGKFADVKEYIESTFSKFDPDISWRSGWYDVIVHIKDIDLHDAMEGSIGLRSNRSILTTTSEVTTR
jgi:hypothetical protein